MTIQEKKEACSQIFITWMLNEQHGKDMTKHNDEVAELFTSRMITKKFEVFGIDIVLPDELLLILYFCVEANPGQFQIILKDLLNSIKSRKGPIPAGYTITADDFSMCFMTDFPITEIKSIEDKYMKLWDGQKKERKGTFDSDNKCDTPEWWKEVME